MNDYRLDTCDCVLEEHWDYTSGVGVRTLLRMKTACQRHASDPDHTRCYDEMRRKNQVLAEIVAVLPAITYAGHKASLSAPAREVLDTLEQAGQFTPPILKPGATYQWAYASGVLEVDGDALGLSPAQKTTLRARVNTVFGASNVVVK